jgi:hypothetical protein
LIFSIKIRFFDNSLLYALSSSERSIPFFFFIGIIKGDTPPTALPLGGPASSRIEQAHGITDSAFGVIRHIL